MTLSSTGDIGTVNLTKNPSPSKSKAQRMARSNRHYRSGRIRDYANFTNAEASMYDRRQKS